MKHIRLLQGVLIAFILFSCNTEKANSQNTGIEENATAVSDQENKNTEEAYFTDDSLLCLEVGEMIDFDCLEDKYTVNKDLSDASGRKYHSIINKGEEVIKVFPAMDPRTDTYVNIIGEIIITSPEFINGENIHIGSSIHDFEAAYPNGYYYYDLSDDLVLLTNEGHGAEYILDASALKDKSNSNVGRINKDQLTPDAIINKIRIKRSKIENQDAMVNKAAEEQEIIENYLSTLEGKYFLERFSEKYYKIHLLQGDYFISECREDECDNRGKILGVDISNGFKALNIDGIQGEMVPTWTIVDEADGRTALYVHDYYAIDDEWTDEVFYKMVDE